MLELAGGAGEAARLTGLFAMHGAETQAAAMRVIAARLPYLLSAWFLPSSRGHERERARMVSEKVEAALAANMAVAPLLAAAWLDAARRGLEIAGTTLAPADAGRGSLPTTATGLWLAGLQQTASVYELWLAVGRAALQPYHKRVVANDRRLARRRR